MLVFGLWDLDLVRTLARAILLPAADPIPLGLSLVCHRWRDKNLLWLHVSASTELLCCSCTCGYSPMSFSTTASLADTLSLAWSLSTLSLCWKLSPPFCGLTSFPCILDLVV